MRGLNTEIKVKVFKLGLWQGFSEYVSGIVMCSDWDDLKFIGVDKIPSRMIFDMEVADSFVPMLVFS